ncbi:hypothetical protein [Shewanella sp. T24-MNA-CIBAN-0130]|uniref:hypothetical protein n=1 Tax=Shewanella sp. T24-MNA-CIBAN-0130 TaxID=3140470 RepID=UPI00331D71C8
MSKLESIAKRISEISTEIHAAQTQRSTNLEKCHGDEDFLEFDKYGYGDCLTTVFGIIKSERTEDDFTDSRRYYDEILDEHGCKNCISARKLKKAIGKLKQERGRLVGNISKIGSSL